MDYPCGKFGDCSFNRFGFIARTVGDRQTESHTDAAKCLTHESSLFVVHNTVQKQVKNRPLTLLE